MLPSARPGRPGDDGPGPEGGVPAEPAGETVDWTGLPEPVRVRIAELAASALGKLPADDVPRQLRPVARFAPAKRARLGAQVLLTGLKDSTRFRTAVLEWLREHRQDALDPNAPDTVAAAAAAVLLGEASASTRVRLVAKNAEESTLRAERDAAMARARRLETDLAAVQAELEDAREVAERAGGEREAELDRLRGRLREQGVQLRKARDEAAQARTGAEQASAARDAELEELRARLERERQRAAAERTRAERASTEAELARQSAREARDADETRLGLLLDTLDGAVHGLRRELAVGRTTQTTRGHRPADRVRGASAGPLGGRVRDAAGLDRLLALPHVHLVVDGYNVTKTGYPELTLADQRDRLAAQLSALAARTGAEVTVVFDGAGVTSVPAAAPRGVRVLFSDPGVQADDVIRDLVATEPGGRPVVVATSDRAVANSVHDSGAHPVASAILLTRLGRV